MTNMTYDPNMIAVETTEGAMADHSAAITAAQALVQGVIDGAAALDNGADAKAMAAYFRVLVCEAARKSHILL